MIDRTLERVAGQRRQAAEILGISLDALNLKIRCYGLEEREYNPAMIFSPLIFFLMAIFFLVALILLPFLMVGLIGEAFLRLGISPSLVFLGLLILPWWAASSNIAHLQSQKPGTVGGAG